ncbi:hypothetical protein [Luteimonas notoginsengisoli]|uniref:DUF3277 family protein n=1 Tax=Luteimonas notoginsengisoli TaxID=1578200 RepID=A0ABV7UQ33_9GAMM
MSDILLDGIALPEDLLWIDEFTAWKVGQAIKPSLTGARIVHESALQAGRPITLETQQGSNDYVGCVTLDVLRALQASEEVPGNTFALVMPAHNSGTRTFTVAWRRSDGAAIDARPIKHITPQFDGDYYAVTLRLMTV